MNRRRLALKVAIVGVVAAAGVGIAASPAVAMPIECYRIAYWNQRAATMMNQDGISFQDWNGWYDLWLNSERFLDANCADD